MLFKNYKIADPLHKIRLQTAAIYILIGFAIIVTLDYFMVSAIRGAGHATILSSTSEEIYEQVYRKVGFYLWISRCAEFFLYAVAVYFIAGKTIRPIKRSTELQKHFVSTISHELRTPLATAKNVSEIALRNESALTREKAVAVIKSNLSDLNHLTEVVNFLFAFSKLEGKMKSIELGPVVLEEVVEKTLPSLQYLAEEKGVTLTATADIEGEVFGNSVALQQLLSNLVKNAITYTEKGGKVEIRIQGTPKNVFLSVADTGKGISQKDRQYIFEPFYRGQKDEGGALGSGIGLGLAIAKEIARLHGATLEVETEEERGSTFLLKFKGTVKS